jgi:all-trans-retinol 13,14-reductase
MARPIGTSWDAAAARGPFDAVVVGSGVGGLAAAATLARRAGKRVLVLERHTTAGGLTHTFERAGYEWDVGLHYVGQMGDPARPARRVFDFVTGGAVEWAPLPEVYDRIRIGGEPFDLVAGKERFLAALGARFPAERRGLERYLQAVRACVRAATAYWPVRAMPPWLAGTLGAVLRSGLDRHDRRTTAQVLADTIRDPLLRAVLAGQYGDYGLPPGRSSFAAHATVVAHYLGGAWYPVGGSSRIAAAAVPVVEAAGGRVMVSAEVERIHVEGGRAAGVRMTDGTVVRAPAVVSDAGWAITAGSLVPEEWRPRFPAPGGLPPSPGHLALYAGFRATDADLGLDGTNVWAYRDADLDGAFDRFEADPGAPFPGVYLSFPSAKDPSAATRMPGRATVEAITVAPWAHWARWEGTRWRRRGDDYDAWKARMSDRLLEALLAERPRLRGRVDHAELSTPLSTRHFAGHPRGEIYGLAAVPRRFTRGPPVRTPLPGLLLAGQDAGMLGVTGSLFGGVLAAAALLREDTVAAILRA